MCYSCHFHYCKVNYLIILNGLQLAYSRFQFHILITQIWICIDQSHSYLIERQIIIWISTVMRTYQDQLLCLSQGKILVLMGLPHSLLQDVDSVHHYHHIEIIIINNQRIPSNHTVPLPLPPVRRSPAPPWPPARSRKQPSIPPSITTFEHHVSIQQLNQWMRSVTFGKPALISQQTEIPSITTFNIAPQSLWSSVTQFPPPPVPFSRSSNLDLNNNNNYSAPVLPPHHHTHTSTIDEW